MNQLAASGAAAHIVVADTSAETLSDRDHHHLSRVLRLRPGTLVSLGDGAGNWRLVRLGRGAAMEPAGNAETVPRPSSLLTVGFALTKGDKPDLVVQKLTEIGIDEIAVFSARRSVVQWESDRVTPSLERQRRVAEAAVAQCRRPWSPTVSYHSSAAELAARSGVVKADIGGRYVTPSDCVILVGPEGGWDAADRLDEMPSVGLAENVLRAETAAIAGGLSLVTARRFLA